MAANRNGQLYECVVVDLNTQYDFCDPNGAYPVANVDTLTAALRHMIAWTKRNGVPVASSIESHRPGEFGDNGHPLCCIDGTPGQRKIDFTLFPRCERVEVDNTLSCPVNLFKHSQQVIFRKRTDDLLCNPKADRFFTQLPVKEFILFGISLESSVKALTLALVAREKRVVVVVDACGYWSRATADLAARQLMAKGAQTIEIADLLQRKLDRNRRYPRLPRVRTLRLGDEHDGPDRSSHSARRHPHQSPSRGAGPDASVPKPCRKVGEDGA